MKNPRKNCGDKKRKRRPNERKTRRQISRLGAARVVVVVGVPRLAEEETERGEIQSGVRGETEIETNGDGSPSVPFLLDLHFDATDEEQTEAVISSRFSLLSRRGSGIVGLTL